LSVRVCARGWCARAAAPIAGYGIDKRKETTRLKKEC
jgi:hypothetical protein